MRPLTKSLAPGLADHVPFSAGLKKVHELAVREGLRLGHNYVGTEHILLGLLEARDEPGAQVLTGLGCSRLVLGHGRITLWTN